MPWCSGKPSALPVYQMRSSPFHRMFGPPDAGIPSRRSYPRGWIDPKEPANRTPEVDTSATGHPYVRSQPGRKGEGVPRVRHRLKRFCRRSASRGAPLPAALSAGFAGNSQRTLSHRRRTSQSFPHGARPSGPDHTRRGLPPDWIEVLPSSPESRLATSTRSKESCFFGVKIFSYSQSQL